MTPAESLLKVITRKRESILAIAESCGRMGLADTKRALLDAALVCGAERVKVENVLAGMPSMQTAEER